MKTQYVLITPVHNEENLVATTIESVAVQTILPAKWVIADDGSTDKTGEIVKQYAARHDFIEYHYLERSSIKTYYARRIEVILAAIERIKHVQYDFLAILDADISLPPTYYENILREFDRNPKLGIASGVYTNYVNGRLQKVVRDDDNISTPGGLQVFRRECYQSIGGHVPLLYGGSDALVGILARMNSWQTRAFREYETIHYRPVGVWGGSNILRARFRQGMQDYDLGTHPLFMMAKSFRRIFREKPYFLCGAMRLLGFLYLSLRRGKRGISDNALMYVRSEQIKRIGFSIQRFFRLKGDTISETHRGAADTFSPAEKDFILISPVYNEKEFIEQLIKSVISQSVRPTKWAIVDNGSTDGTDEIVKLYATRNDFIIYHWHERSTTGSYYYHKVEAFLSGYDQVKHLKYSFIACLDADLTLEPTYYEDILREFKHNPRLGIASGAYINKINGRLRKVVRDSSSTPGGLQVFRRECYESIGGYTPLQYGGEDALANIIARMHGWQTKSFPVYEAIHHRPLGVRGVRGGTEVLKGKFIQGMAEYDLWTHPLFMLAKSFRRMFIEKPYVLASTARLLGFCQSCLRREPRSVPDEVKKFVRKEQLRRLLYLWQSDWQQK